MKKILLSSLLLLLSVCAISQDEGMKIGITGGWTPGGYAGNVNINYHLYSDYVQAGVYTSFSNVEYEAYEIPYNIFTFNAGYFYPILEDYRQYTKLAVGGGAVAGYELVNNGNKELENGAIIESDSKFIYGGFISAEFDFALSSNMWLVAKVNEYYHVNSELGEFTFYGGAGIRIGL